MDVRLQWSIVVGIAVIVVAAAFATAGAPAPATGTVKAVIGAGSTDRLVDVALIDVSGQEYAGENRGAGGSETLQQIPAGRVQVDVGACSTPAVVRPGRTVVVRFDALTCIR